MYEKSCACGASKKNFKIDIGAFFVNDCCLEAGFDELGKKKDIGLAPEEVQEVLKSQDAQALQILDEGEQPDPAELAEDEAAKKKAEKEALKAAKKAEKAAAKAAKENAGN